MEDRAEVRSKSRLWGSGSAACVHHVRVRGTGDVDVDVDVDVDIGSSRAFGASRSWREDVGRRFWFWVGVVGG